MIKLLPCPFCGSEKVNVGSSLENDAEQWSVLCSDCGSSCSCYCENEQVAIRDWNTRAPAQTPPDGFVSVELLNTERSVSDDLRERNAKLRAQSSLRAAAERVCWFDWSDNDMDAVAAIDALRKAVTHSD